MQPTEFFSILNIFVFSPISNIFDADILVVEFVKALKNINIGLSVLSGF